MSLFCKEFLFWHEHIWGLGRQLFVFLNGSILVNKNLKSVDFHEAGVSNGQHITASAEKKKCKFIYFHKQLGLKIFFIVPFSVFIQPVRFQEFSKFELQPHSPSIIITASTSGFQTLLKCAYFVSMIFPLWAVLFTT